MTKKPWTKEDAEQLQALTKEMIAEYGEEEFLKMARACEAKAFEKQGEEK